MRHCRSNIVENRAKCAAATYALASRCSRVWLTVSGCAARHVGPRRVQHQHHHTAALTSVPRSPSPPHASSHCRCTKDKHYLCTETAVVLLLQGPAVRAACELFIYLAKSRGVSFGTIAACYMYTRLLEWDLRAPTMMAANGDWRREQAVVLFPTYEFHEATQGLAVSVGRKQLHNAVTSKHGGSPMRFEVRLQVRSRRWRLDVWYGLASGCVVVAAKRLQTVRVQPQRLQASKLHSRCFPHTSPVCLRHTHPTTTTTTIHHHHYPPQEPCVEDLRSFTLPRLMAAPATIRMFAEEQAYAYEKNASITTISSYNAATMSNPEKLPTIQALKAEAVPLRRFPPPAASNDKPSSDQQGGAGAGSGAAGTDGAAVDAAGTPTNAAAAAGKAKSKKGATQQQQHQQMSKGAIAIDIGMFGNLSNYPAPLTSVSSVPSSVNGGGRTRMDTEGELSLTAGGVGGVSGGDMMPAAGLMSSLLHRVGDDDLTRGATPAQTPGPTPSRTGGPGEAGDAHSGGRDQATSPTMANIALLSLVNFSQSQSEGNDSTDGGAAAAAASGGATADAMPIEQPSFDAVATVAAPPPLQSASGAINDDEFPVDSQVIAGAAANQPLSLGFSQSGDASGSSSGGDDLDHAMPTADPSAAGSSPSGGNGSGGNQSGESMMPLSQESVSLTQQLGLPQADFTASPAGAAGVTFATSDLEASSAAAASSSAAGGLAKVSSGGAAASGKNAAAPSSSSSSAAKAGPAAQNHYPEVYVPHTDTRFANLIDLRFVLHTCCTNISSKNPAGRTGKGSATAAAANAAGFDFERDADDAAAQVPGPAASAAGAKNKSRAKALGPGTTPAAVAAAAGLQLAAPGTKQLAKGQIPTPLPHPDAAPDGGADPWFRMPDHGTMRALRRVFNDVAEVEDWYKHWEEICKGVAEQVYADAAAAAAANGVDEEGQPIPASSSPTTGLSGNPAIFKDPYNLAAAAPPSPPPHPTSLPRKSSSPIDRPRDRTWPTDPINIDYLADLDLHKLAILPHLLPRMYDPTVRGDVDFTYLPEREPPPSLKEVIGGYPASRRTGQEAVARNLSGAGGKGHQMQNFYNKGAASAGAGAGGRGAAAVGGDVITASYGGAAAEFHEENYGTESHLEGGDGGVYPYHLHQGGGMPLQYFDNAAQGYPEDYDDPIGAADGSTGYYYNQQQQAQFDQYGNSSSGAAGGPGGPGLSQLPYPSFAGTSGPAHYTATTSGGAPRYTNNVWMTEMHPEISPEQAEQRRQAMGGGPGAVKAVAGQAGGAGGGKQATGGKSKDSGPASSPTAGSVDGGDGDGSVFSPAAGTAPGIIEQPKQRRERRKPDTSNPYSKDNYISSFSAGASKRRRGGAAADETSSEAAAAAASSDASVAAIDAASDAGASAGGRSSGRRQSARQASAAAAAVVVAADDDMGVGGGGDEQAGPLLSVQDAQHDTPPLDEDETTAAAASAVPSRGGSRSSSPAGKRPKANTSPSTVASTGTAASSKVAARTAGAATGAAASSSSAKAGGGGRGAAGAPAAASSRPRTEPIDQDEAFAGTSSANGGLVASDEGNGEMDGDTSGMAYHHPAHLQQGYQIGVDEHGQPIYNDDGGAGDDGQQHQQQQEQGRYYMGEDGNMYDAGVDGGGVDGSQDFGAGAGGGGYQAHAPGYGYGGPPGMMVQQQQLDGGGGGGYAGGYGHPMHQPHHQQHQDGYGGYPYPQQQVPHRPGFAPQQQQWQPYAGAGMMQGGFAAGYSEYDQQQAMPPAAAAAARQGMGAGAGRGGGRVTGQAAPRGAAAAALRQQQRAPPTAAAAAGGARGGRGGMAGGPPPPRAGQQQQMMMQQQPYPPMMMQQQRGGPMPAGYYASGPGPAAGSLPTRQDSFGPRGAPPGQHLQAKPAAGGARAGQPPPQSFQHPAVAGGAGVGAAVGRMPRPQGPMLGPQHAPFQQRAGHPGGFAGPGGAAMPSRAPSIPGMGLQLGVGAGGPGAGGGRGGPGGYAVSSSGGSGGVPAIPLPPAVKGQASFTAGSQDMHQAGEM